LPRAAADGYSARVVKREDNETRDPRLAYRGHFLEMWSHGVSLPNGNEAELEVVHHPGAAAVVPFVDPGRVLLIRQYRFAALGDLLEVPAGKLDPGESPEVCAARELEEETGVRAGRLESLGPMWPSPGFTDEQIHLFAGFDLEPARQNLEADEVIETFELSLEEALDQVWSGGISDAKSALALVRAAHLIGRLR
jgi:ADP-ribose pyrophosphatase